MARLILTLACVLLLAGCATPILGNAAYSYENGACKATIVSRRDVGGPVKFEIDKDCNLKAETGDLKGGGISEDTVNRFLDKVPDVGALPASDFP